MSNPKSKSYSYCHMTALAVEIFIRSRSVSISESLLDGWQCPLTLVFLSSWSHWIVCPITLCCPCQTSGLICFCATKWDCGWSLGLEKNSFGLFLMDWICFMCFWNGFDNWWVHMNKGNTQTHIVLHDTICCCNPLIHSRWLYVAMDTPTTMVIKCLFKY